MKWEKDGKTVFLNDIYQVYHLAIVEEREKTRELIPKLNCYQITKETFNLQSVSNCNHLINFSQDNQPQVICEKQG